MFSATVALNQVKPNIIPLITKFGINIDDLQCTKIEKQWMELHQVKWEWDTADSKKDGSLTRLWTQILLYEDIANNQRFKDLAEFVLSLLILPHSNAEVERLFSVMNCIKSKARNRMSSEVLNAILQVRFGLKIDGSCCHNYAHRIAIKYLKEVDTLQKYDFKKYDGKSAASADVEAQSSTSTQNQQCNDDIDLDDDDLDLDLFNDNLLFL
ncbi:hypothetical protein U1Q18_044859 [Sarracenia purpurea var. burkii]